MSIADAIASLGGTATYGVVSSSSAYDSHGRLASPTITPTTTTGMVQPLNGREIQNLPEGLHGKEVRYFWTKDTLALASSAGISPPTTGAVLSIGGESWAVRGCESWAPYNRYLLEKVDP